MPRAVLNDFGHAAERRRADVSTRLEKISDLLLRPACQPDVLVTQALGIPPFQFRAGQESATGSILERLLLEGDAARRVAGAAMPRPLDEIGATRHLRRRV